MEKILWIHSMRDFLILWGSQMISSLGSSMTSFALIIWVYQQKGTAISISLLSFFTYLPSILFCFIAGTLADRWNKKHIMLTSDLVAAMGTVLVLTLYSTGKLHTWHLYFVNFLISFMNAFQSPAVYVATSLLVPKEHYVRAGGLHAFSNSLVSILTPALATSVLAFGGLKTVLIVDISTFAVAFLTLLFFVKLPEAAHQIELVKQSFFQNCLDGVRFLRKRRGLLHLIAFFSFINLIAYMTGFNLMPALILARTGSNQVALGLISTALGIGTLVGSILVTVFKPPKNRVQVVLISCAVSFAICNLIWAIGRSVPIWIFAAFAGNLPLPFLNANLMAIMRASVPIEMQGRVFSTRDTLQYSTIPLGLFLGGFLADHVFEPFMQIPSPIQKFLSLLVGSDKGSGMAVMFLITGIVGSLSSLLCIKDPAYKDLEK